MPAVNYKLLGQSYSGSVQYLPISTHSLTSNVVTLTSGIDHGAKPGDEIFIAGNTNTILNGNFVVSSISGSTSFLYPRTNANISPASTTTTSAYRFSAPIGRAVTNKIKTNGVATLTVSDTTGITANSAIRVWINDANFDGSYLVYDVPNATTFRYIVIGTDVATTAVTAGGVAVYIPQNVYTVPSGKSALCSTFNVTNVNPYTSTFTAYVVPSQISTPAPDASCILEQVVVNPRESIAFTLGQTMGAGDKFVVVPTSSGLAFSLFGSEIE